MTLSIIDKKKLTNFVFCNKVITFDNAKEMMTIIIVFFFVNQQMA